MKIRIESNGIQVDSWLQEFIQTTVGFATWHYRDPRARASVAVHLQGDALGRGSVRCHLQVQDSAVSSIRVRAHGKDIYESVATAADRLEVALYRRQRPPAAPAVLRPAA